ncbi:hypothetical protein [Bradyrhizobium ivorense]|uniref:hypothetical protein n=1 Tax=Bradyrhizobium ivorense TaxID=2511166 RepID=UPI00155AB7DB|nr:hypothetical protein [Bradyrhizobium ivorense]
MADDFGSVYSQFIEFMAGRAAARMLLDGEPAAPVNDLYQARELARLICTSDEAIDAFIGHCDVAARDLLMAYGDAVMALSVVLRRTLDGAETDQIIREMEARKALAVEYPRRAEWRKSELAASWFRDECNHLNAAPPSHLAQDRMV